MYMKYQEKMESILSSIPSRKEVKVNKVNNWKEINYRVVYEIGFLICEILYLIVR